MDRDVDRIPQSPAAGVIGSRAGTIMAGASILKITVSPTRFPRMQSRNPDAANMRKLMAVSQS